MIREFDARHYAPLVAHRFPDDGTTGRVENMLDRLNDGGELVCADIDGAWVAGIFNVANQESYDLLERGDKPLRDTARGAGRFPGISRWYVLAEPQTLAAGDAQLSARERIVPIPVTLRGDDRSLWMGEALPSPAVSA